MSARILQTILLLIVWPFCVIWSAISSGCAVSLVIARHITEVWSHRPSTKGDRHA